MFYAFMLIGFKLVVNKTFLLFPIMKC